MSSHTPSRNTTQTGDKNLPQVPLEEVKPGQVVIYRSFEPVTFSDFYGVSDGRKANVEKRPLPYLVLEARGTTLSTVSFMTPEVASLGTSGIHPNLWKYLAPISPKQREQDDQLKPLKLTMDPSHRGGSNWLDIRRIVKVKPDNRNIMDHSGEIRVCNTNLVGNTSQLKMLLEATRKNEGLDETKARHAKLLAEAEERIARHERNEEEQRRKLEEKERRRARRDGQSTRSGRK